jgi:hypothetical protein
MKLFKPTFISKFSHPSLETLKEVETINSMEDAITHIEFWGNSIDDSTTVLQGEDMYFKVKKGKKGIYINYGQFKK